MIRRYIASTGGVLVPAVTFTGVSACTVGQQPTNFTVNCVAGTVLGLKITMGGFFIWDNTVGSRNVSITGNIQVPSGAPLANNLNQTFTFTGQTGQQSFSLASTALFFVTVGVGGSFSVQTNANIQNAGSGYLSASSFVVASVNGQGTATQLSICTGFSTG